MNADFVWGLAMGFGIALLAVAVALWIGSYLGRRDDP